MDRLDVVALIYRAWHYKWFWNKDLTRDWVWRKAWQWRRHFRPLRRTHVRILEIGSFEGRSAIFFLRYLPESTIVCVDSFMGSTHVRHIEMWEREIPKIEGRFDRNLAEFGGRVRKIAMESRSALAMLRKEGAYFDLVYIDASHKSDDVWEDSIRAWDVTKSGAMIMWDDYEWQLKVPSEDRPKPAIDRFLHLHKGEYQLLEKGYQIVIRRTR